MMNYLLGVRNYLNNYFAMYTRLTRSVYGWYSHPPTQWGYELLKNYFVLYARMTCSDLRVEQASPAYSG